MNDYNRIKITNEDTGEETRQVLKKNEILVPQREYSEKEKYFMNKKNDIRKYNEELGGFINMSYRDTNVFDNLNPSTVTRLIYLATFIDYNNKECNLLVKRTQHNKLVPMTRADIKQVMGLSEAQFKKFLKELKDNELLFENNNKFYISDVYFQKGKIDNMEGNTSYRAGYYTRVYINTVRALYNSCDVREHKTLSYIFRLIPYVHCKNNALVADANDSVVKGKLEATDVMQILGLSTNKRAKNKMLDKLSDFYITVNGKKYYVMNWIKVKQHTEEGKKVWIDYLCISPMLISKCNDYEVIQEVNDKLQID